MQEEKSQPPKCISCGGSGTAEVPLYHYDEDGDLDDVETEVGPCPSCEGMGHD